MTLSNITTLSQFTDNAPASPAYFNAKWAEVEANFDTLAGVAAPGDYIYAHLQSGADWAAKVTAALAALPAAGGVVDATGLTGAQTATAAVAVSKPCYLKLGPMTLTTTDGWLTVTSDDVTVEGMGRGWTRIVESIAWDANDHYLLDVQGADGFTLRRCGLALTLTGTTVAADVYAVAALIRDNTGHTTGSTNFVVEDNDIVVTGTEPSTGNKMFGVLTWTRTAAPPRLTANGLIRGNTVRSTPGRCIETALCKNITVTGNSITDGGGSGAVVCVGVRVIGSGNVSVVGNSIAIAGAALANSDGIQVNGDNTSENVTITGNAVTSTAGAGAGIRIGSNASEVVVSGNHVFSPGTASALFGILVSNSVADGQEPRQVLVSGNRVAGFTNQLAVQRSRSTDSFPFDVAFTGNMLGKKYDGTDTFVTYYNFSTASLTSQRIRVAGNVIDTTSNITNHDEQFLGAIRTIGIVGRNVADTSNVTMLRLTTSDIVQVGSSGAVEVQLSNGIDVIRMPASGHWRPNADGTQDLGSPVARWGKMFLGGQSIASDGLAISPSYAFSSESSLGFFRSGVSTIAQSFGTFRASELWATSGLSVGDGTVGGTRIPGISSTSSLVAAFVVQGSSSSFTIITWAAARANDIVWVTPTSLNAAVSSLSSGIVAHSHCTQNGQVEMRLSNCSTLAQNVSSNTWFLTRITPF